MTVRSCLTVRLRGMLLACLWCLRPTILTLAVNVLACRRVAATRLVTSLNDMFRRLGVRARRQAAQLPSAKVPLVVLSCLRTVEALLV